MDFALAKNLMATDNDHTAPGKHIFVLVLFSNYSPKVDTLLRLCCVLSWTRIGLSQSQKLRKIFLGRLDVQVTFELYSHFRCRQALYSKNTFIRYCLTQWITKLLGSHWVWQYLVNFTGLAGIANKTIYKTDQFSQGSGISHCPHFWDCYPI